MKALRIAVLAAVPSAALGAAVVWASVPGPDANPAPSVIPGGPPPALRATGRFAINGPLAGPNDISGVGFSGDLLVLVSDERPTSNS